ncbi:MAG: hypothetical protein AAFZ15_33890 [Bacteroidota bacterium]
MKTKVVIIEQQALSLAQKEEMWSIYKEYYHYSRAYFMERMKKNTHFSLYLTGRKIGGFTGLRIGNFKVCEKNNFLIYFGQTVITHQLRGQSLIPVTGFKLVLKYWRKLFMSDAWFWYDALSYKAYLVSAKTLTEYYPSCHIKTPVKTKVLMDKVGRFYYADNYCPKTGTVTKQSNCLNDHTVKIYESDLLDREIAFFASANPRYELGHGLLTFAPINWTNIKLLTRRFFKNYVKTGSLSQVRNKRPKWVIKMNK